MLCRKSPEATVDTCPIEAVSSALFLNLYGPACCLYPEVGIGI